MRIFFDIKSICINEFKLAFLYASYLMLSGFITVIINTTITEIIKIAIIASVSVNACFDVEVLTDNTIPYSFFFNSVPLTSNGIIN